MKEPEYLRLVGVECPLLKAARERKLNIANGLEKCLDQLAGIEFALLRPEQQELLRARWKLVEAALDANSDVEGLVRDAVAIYHKQWGWQALGPFKDHGRKRTGGEP